MQIRFAMVEAVKKRKNSNRTIKVLNLEKISNLEILLLHTDILVISESNLFT